jgi:hypothetical protein
VLGEGVDLPAALVRLPDPANLVRENLRHRKLALPDQVGVPRCTDNAELIHVAGASGDTSISEIEPKEVWIRRERKRLSVPRTEVAVAQLTTEVRSAPNPLAPDGAPGSPCLAGALTVIPAGSDEFEDKRNFLFGAHFATLLTQARVA